MRVLFKSPNEKFEEREVENSLESMQKLVHGFVEQIPTDIHDKVFMLVNEEGKLIGLEPNLHYYRDVIVGNIVFVSISNNGVWKSLSNVQIDAIKRYFGVN